MLRDTGRRLPGKPARPVIYKQPVLIGGIYPLHGPAAVDDAGRRKATEMAVAEVNKQGGIARPVAHVPVEFDIVDRSSLTRAISALVEREVDAITFGYTLARDDFATALGKAADFGCPVLHSATSATAHQTVLDQPDRFDNVFQVCAQEDRYGLGFIRFLNELAASGAWQPPNRRLLIIDSNDPNLTTFTAEAAAAADRSGWQATVVGIDFLRPDWQSVLARLGEIEPAAVMVATWVEEGLHDFLRAFQATGLPSLLYAIYAPPCRGSCGGPAIWPKDCCGRRSSGGMRMRSVGSSPSGFPQPSTAIRAGLGRPSTTTWSICSVRRGGRHPTRAIMPR